MRSAAYAKTLQWDRDINLWAQGLADNAIAVLEGFLENLIKRYAVEIEAWMKTNAHWTDRTGNARAGLNTEVELLVHQAYSVVLDHADDVPYGVWLELKHQGRYAIIQPALDHFFPLVWRDVVAFVRS